MNRRQSMMMSSLDVVGVAAAAAADRSAFPVVDSRLQLPNTIAVDDVDGRTALVMMMMVVRVRSIVVQPMSVDSTVVDCRHYFHHRLQTIEKQ